MTVMNNEDPADPSPHEPRVTGAPEAIWLVYGELEHDDTHRNCCRDGAVTWCEDAQFTADVRYTRTDLVAERVRAAVAERDAEIERLRKALLTCARQAEALKRDCGMDPESAQALRNSQYQAISTTAHIALGTIKGATDAN